MNEGHWIGKSCGINGDQTHYKAHSFSGHVYSVGDTVMVQSPLETLSFARIISLWEEQGQAWMKLQWFFRPLDVLGKDLQGSSVVTPTGTFPLQDYITGMSDRELLETDSFGDYPISILVSKASVIFLKTITPGDRRMWDTKAEGYYFYSLHLKVTNREVIPAIDCDGTEEESDDVSEEIEEFYDDDRSGEILDDNPFEEATEGTLPPNITSMLPGDTSVLINTSFNPSDITAPIESPAIFSSEDLALPSEDYGDNSVLLDSQPQQSVAMLDSSVDASSSLEKPRVVVFAVEGVTVAPPPPAVNLPTVVTLDTKVTITSDNVPSLDAVNLPFSVTEEIPPKIDEAKETEYKEQDGGDMDVQTEQKMDTNQIEEDMGKIKEMEVEDIVVDLQNPLRMEVSSDEPITITTVTVTETETTMKETAEAMTKATVEIPATTTASNTNDLKTPMQPTHAAQELEKSKLEEIPNAVTTNVFETKSPKIDLRPRMQKPSVSLIERRKHTAHDISSTIQLHESPNRCSTISLALEQHVDNLNSITVKTLFVLNKILQDQLRVSRYHVGCINNLQEKSGQTLRRLYQDIDDYKALNALKTKATTKVPKEADTQQGVKRKRSSSGSSTASRKKGKTEDRSSSSAAKNKEKRKEKTQKHIDSLDVSDSSSHEDIDR